MLPRVLVMQGKADFPFALAIHPERLCDFMAAHGLSGEPEGEPTGKGDKKQETKDESSESEESEE